VIVYLDTSAIIKLLRREAETDALLTHLAQHTGHDLLTSALATVEVNRALKAIGAADAAEQAVHRSDQVEFNGQTIPAVAMTTPVLDLARTLPPTILRSLDAIHLATAVLAGDSLHHLISYDKRLIVAAGAAGIRTEAPT